MKIIKGTEIKPFNVGNGETVRQYTGRLEKHGMSKYHSLAVMTLAPGASSEPHFHKVAEESFLIVKGQAIIEVDGLIHSLFEGDCAFVRPGERHTLRNIGSETLECVIATGPAWNSEDSI